MEARSDQFVLALDQGTTSARAILFGRHGNIHGIAQQEITQHYPQPGWVEHDTDEIWQVQLAVARAVLRDNGVSATQIVAAGITNQRETTVLWDRSTGEPLHRAIVWQDRRTAGICDELTAAGHAELFRERTGLVVDAYFSGTKLKWLLDHIPDARARAERGELAFGTIDSWLAWKLSGGQAHVTDPSNASRTLLFDIHRRCWDDELLALLDIPPALLPRIVDSSGEIATIAAEWLGAEIPLSGMAGDQQAATFGQACLEHGMAKSTYGTGCFLLMNTGQAPMASSHRLLTTVGWQRQGHTTYLLEGSVFMGGATVQWLRDGLGLISSADQIEALAASVPDNGGVYLVPAHTGLGAPYWDPFARGALFGLTRGTTRAHIARAALEAIAFQSAEVLQAMENDAGQRLSELRVDGGAAKNDLLMQFQADLLGVPVVRPKITETTALGAAYLAGLAVGFWRDEAELTAMWQAEHCFEPAMAESRRTELFADWHRAVERSLHWAKAE
ncbi:glycerol kinase GlpK [Ferribacterium limneticum]|uniref:glycerol kinase GlpK n=1 Tax=Ferribacterium limneticum TaxID=76259 RepID=UPI001CFBB796|nr:glycerol kinase GlpK [Ferribacterium limneticum]UCV30060.1 glycerol kinase GlpK [Ferribacterium limneticum]UCV33979.1 glycerol kinase GlpK [Ferribacterium limneticum]